MCECEYASVYVCVSVCVYVSMCDLDGDSRTFTSPPRQDRLHRPLAYNNNNIILYIFLPARDGLEMMDTTSKRKRERRKGRKKKKKEKKERRKPISTREVATVGCICICYNEGRLSYTWTGTRLREET